MRQGIDLAKNVNVVADTTPVLWVGGRSVLVLIATVFPTTCKLQTLAQDASTWIDLNATTFSANQVTPFDLPEGQYRLHMTGGTATAVYASLIATPYT